jgi:hypothetical protein
MLAYVLLACIAIPLVMLVIDVMAPRSADSAEPAGVPALHLDATRPHVTAAAEERRDSHRVADLVDEAPRRPRIAPGDGMVYRPAQPAANPR